MIIHVELYDGQGLPCVACNRPPLLWASRLCSDGEFLAGRFSPPVTMCEQCFAKWAAGAIVAHPQLKHVEQAQLQAAESATPRASARRGITELSVHHRENL